MQDLLGTHPVVIFLVIAAVFGGGSLYLVWKRRKDIEAMAASMGLIFAQEGPDPAALAAAGLELFSLGRSRRAFNMVEVQSQHGAVKLFDYSYTIGSGKSRSVRRHTVALMACGGDIPRFDLKPETLMYKLGEMIGFKDIDLPEFPLFSDKYRLTGPDEERVRAFFGSRRAAWFEQNLGLMVQGAPGFLLLIKQRGLLSPGEWPGFIEEAKAFAAELLR
ncbi:MAG: hypothetical protein M0011_10685 [Elusimicrobia bacterium]|nr:hypothetical protein [Elusimicrobiota bacterium]